MTKILVVEDNRALAKLAKSLIEQDGEFEVVNAYSQTEALSLVGTDPHQYSVAVADINLPDAPNGEVVNLLLATGIPVIVLTGHYGDELRQKMTDSGVVDYVIKGNVSAYQYVSSLVRRIHRNRDTKVLIVDDSPAFSGLLRAHLQVQRLNVLMAGNGEEGLQMLAQNPDIRLVLVDYNMPKMDGFELTHRIRATHGKEDLAIIGLSSSNDGRTSAHFLKSGANDYLAKPYTYEELLCRVNQNLEILDYIIAIQDAANRDYLTRLYNRRHFFESGARLYQQSKMNNIPLCVAMMDIDHFKQVNDTHGHEGGDVALRHMAELLRAHFHDGLVARLGGEEFCVMLPNKKEEAHLRLEAFRQELAKSPIAHTKYSFSFTTSIGMNDIFLTNLDEMLLLADKALYLAKEGGRNRIVCELPTNATAVATSVRQKRRADPSGG